MNRLILLRHGQSLWNKQNLFTGWVDVGLSKTGIEEALQAGEKIKELPIDVVFISSLVRAQTTAMLALSSHSSGKVPVIQHPQGSKEEEWGQIYREGTKEKILPVFSAWQLNERMYGELQGLNKQETREKYGEEQVLAWRRSYATPPPNGESLEMTAKRTLPYFQQEIYPLLKQGKNIFIAAHGNSLRSIIMQLDNLSQEEVISLELATGVPVIYEYSNGTLCRST